MPPLPPTTERAVVSSRRTRRGSRHGTPRAAAGVGRLRSLRGEHRDVGLTADCRLLLVTVDGRQPGYSVGMTRPEVAALLRRLGATDPRNLDGGGSTTMVLVEHAVNRPSDATGDRPVANALTVLGPAPGSCPP